MGLNPRGGRGAELWHNMSVSDTCKLEKFIRLAAIQRIPTRRRLRLRLRFIQELRSINTHILPINEI